MAVPTIDPLPTPPTRADPANFATRADAWVIALVLFVAQMNAAGAAVNASTLAAAAAAASALASPGTSATSTTSLTIGAGNKSFTIQANKALVVGQFVTIASPAPGAYMVGQVTAHDPSTGAMTVAVTSVGGAGTFASWTIGLSSPMQFLAATAAVIWGGTDATTVVTPAGIAAAAAPVALADAATITPDLSTGLNFALTLGGNRTLANPVNMQPGDSGIIVVKQDATGGRTLGRGSYWKFAGGAVPLSTGANAIDVISYTVIDATTVIATVTRLFS